MLFATQVLFKCNERFGDMDVFKAFKMSYDSRHVNTVTQQARTIDVLTTLKMNCYEFIYMMAK